MNESCSCRLKVTAGMIVAPPRAALTRKPCKLCEPSRRVERGRNDGDDIEGKMMLLGQEASHCTRARPDASGAQLTLKWFSASRGLTQRKKPLTSPWR